MSNNYSGPMDSVKDFSAGLLSGDGMSAGEKLQQVKSNVSFRVNSAREMVMGIRDQNAMSPMERRSEIRQRRLSLMGISTDSSANGQVTTTGGSRSGTIGEPDSPSPNRGPSTDRNVAPSASVNSVMDDTPLMSEVDRGTKARAQDRGFQS